MDHQFTIPLFSDWQPEYRELIGSLEYSANRIVDGIEQQIVASLEHTESTLLGIRDMDSMDPTLTMAKHDLAYIRSLGSRLDHKILRKVENIERTYIANFEAMKRIRDGITEAATLRQLIGYEAELIGMLTGSVGFAPKSQLLAAISTQANAIIRRNPNAGGSTLSELDNELVSLHYDNPENLEECEKIMTIQEQMQLLVGGEFTVTPIIDGSIATTIASINAKLDTAIPAIMTFARAMLLRASDELQKMNIEKIGTSLGGIEDIRESASRLGMDALKLDLATLDQMINEAKVLSLCNQQDVFGVGEAAEIERAFAQVSAISDDHFTEAKREVLVHLTQALQQVRSQRQEQVGVVVRDGADGVTSPSQNGPSPVEHLLRPESQSLAPENVSSPSPRQSVWRRTWNTGWNTAASILNAATYPVRAVVDVANSIAATAELAGSMH